MNLLLLAFALALAAAPLAVQAAAPGEAGEKTLRLAPKEAIVSSAPVFVSPAGVASAQLHAPFLMSDEDPAHLDFEPHPESRRGRPWSCHGDKTLCYDPSTGHIVYKPIRKFMPDIPGLQREDISLNRRRILFKYSF